MVWMVGLVGALPQLQVSGSRGSWWIGVVWCDDTGPDSLPAGRLVATGPACPPTAVVSTCGGYGQDEF